MGGACNMHEGDEKCFQNFGRKTRGVNGKILLNRMLENEVWGCIQNSSGSVRCPVAGSYEQDNEPIGFYMKRKFLDHLSGCQFLKKYSSPFRRVVILSNKINVGTLTTITFNNSFTS
jgi:hypothetical protein